MSEPRAADARVLSLAAGTILDVSPADAVSVAAAAGWPAVGAWFDPDTWTDAVAADVAARAAGSGVRVLDIEPFIFGRGATHQQAIVDAAAHVDARFLLAAGGLAVPGEVADGLAQLCARAAVTAPNLVVVLEFLPIFSVGTLEAAVAVVKEVAAPNLAVLVDTLHLARSNGSPADVAALAALDAGLFPYVQIADATAAPGDTSSAGLRDEALHGRLLPGDGALPIAELLAAVPAADVSVELRSRELMSAFPDPVERARRVLTASRSVVDGALTHPKEDHGQAHASVPR